MFKIQLYWMVYYWNILGILTLGIGFIFINPYRYAAEAAFYNEISGRAEAYYGRKEDRY